MSRSSIIFKAENHKQLPKSMAILQFIFVVVLCVMPIFLRIYTGKWLSSISASAYTNGNSVFVMALALGASMFIYNGAYTRKIYNIILGVSLLVVGLTPHLDVPIPHFSSAAMFFIGNAIAIIVFSSKKERPLKCAIASMIVLPLFIHFTFSFSFITLFVAEWIGMIFIGGHVIAEGFNKID